MIDQGMNTTEVIEALRARGLELTKDRVWNAHAKHGIGSATESRRAGLRFSPADVERLVELYGPLAGTVGLFEAARRLGVSYQTVRRMADKLGAGTQTVAGRRFTDAEIGAIGAASQGPGKKGRPPVHGEYVGWHERFGKGRPRKSEEPASSA